MSQSSPSTRRKLLAGSCGMSAAIGLLAATRPAGAQDGKQSGKARAHQPGEAAFRAVLPEQIVWQPFAAFPPSARLAVVVGDPSGPGPYTIRVKVPDGVKLAPHRHPEDRVYTVISGVFYIGLGDRFDERRLTAYPPGSVVVLPGGTAHFHWAKSGEYVTQVSGIGPLGLDYLDPHDDPRLGSAGTSR
jgi:quercetin dioxygenase-like cupin family protein